MTPHVLILGAGFGGWSWPRGCRLPARPEGARSARPRTWARLMMEELPYDLFIGIPVHRAPAVVGASGLTVGGNDGWVAVDLRNLATRFPQV